MEETTVEVGWESESPFRWWEVCCEPPDALTDPLALVAPGLDAMFQFADGLLEPVAVRTEIGWLDTDGFMSGNAPHMEWKLALRGTDGQRWIVPETLEEVDAVDRAAIEQFLRRATAQRGAPGTVACPGWIGFSRARVRFLEDVAPDITMLRLGRKVGPATVPLEREGDALWVMGPQDGFNTAPVKVILQVDARELRLQIKAHWSPWADDGRPGTRAIEERVARLVSSGWEPTE